MIPLSKRSNIQDFSIGVDIEEVVRFRRLDRIKHRRFLERVFTERELKYCFSKKDPAPHLAVRFCAKEAAVKALAILRIHKVSYRHIEIINTTKGIPKVILQQDYSNLKVNISLAHTKEYAIAFAVIL